MRIRPWITTATLLLVASAVCTIGLDGCSDDGTGSIPSSLYLNGDGAAPPDDPGVSTQTTPPGTPPVTDATVDVVARDAYKPPKPPADTGVVDSATDAGDAGDSG